MRSPNGSEQSAKYISVNLAAEENHCYSLRLLGLISFLLLYAVI